MCRHVVRFADLDIAAVRLRAQRRDRQLCFWYALRGMDRNGKGHADPAALSAASNFLRIRIRTRQRLIREGRPVFWLADGNGGVYLRSPARVSTSLRAGRFRAALVAPLSQLRGSVAVTRARLAILGVAAIRHGAPTSYTTMTKMLAASARAIRYWLGLSGLRPRENFWLIAPISPSTSARDFVRVTREPGLRVVTLGNRPWLVKQIPNSLPLLGCGGVRRHLRRANRRLRSLVAGSASSSGLRGGGTVARRRYHAEVRGAPAIVAPSTITSPFSGADDLTFIKTVRTSRGPVRLWRPSIPLELGGKR